MSALRGLGEAHSAVGITTERFRRTSFLLINTNSHNDRRQCYGGVPFLPRRVFDVVQREMPKKHAKDYNHRRFLSVMTNK